MMKKKDKKAAVIKYFNEQLDVPVISALGAGDFAEKIIKKALENNIKIVENNDFFKFEQLLTVGNEIPGDVYSIVANILSCILKTNGEYLDG